MAPSIIFDAKNEPLKNNFKFSYGIALYIYNISIFVKELIDFIVVT
jgi:hypothetical protein